MDVLMEKLKKKNSEAGEEEEQRDVGEEGGAAAYRQAETHAHQADPAMCLPVRRKASICLHCVYTTTQPPHPDRCPHACAVGAAL